MVPTSKERKEGKGRDGREGEGKKEGEGKGQRQGESCSKVLWGIDAPAVILCLLRVKSSE